MKRGFTLIEIIVVIGIIALALPAMFAIVFGILRQQTKVYALKQVKSEGDFVLNVVENTIRTYAAEIYSNADLTTEECTGLAEKTSYNGTPFYFKDKNGNWFRFYKNSTKISSDSAVLASAVDLTSTKTNITSFNLECSTNSPFSPPVISIDFDIEYNPSATRPEDKAQLNYQTKVKMRSY